MVSLEKLRGRSFSTVRAKSISSQFLCFQVRFCRALFLVLVVTAGFGDKAVLCNDLIRVYDLARWRFSAYGWAFAKRRNGWSGIRSLWIWIAHAQYVNFDIFYCYCNFQLIDFDCNFDCIFLEQKHHASVSFSLLVTYTLHKPVLGACIGLHVKILREHVRAIIFYT